MLNSVQHLYIWLGIDPDPDLSEWGDKKRLLEMTSGGIVLREWCALCAAD
jgi:hypothetical protein